MALSRSSRRGAARPAGALLLVAFACGFSPACLYQGEGTLVDAANVASREEMQRVEGVPEMRQQNAADCGPAALAAVLRYWGTAASIRAIRWAIGDSPSGGIHAGALRDYANERGFDAYLVRGTLDDLRIEIEAGRPVVVGLLKPYLGNRSLAHFAVVTGIGARSVVTMDPADGHRLYPVDGFVSEWEASGNVTLIVAPRTPRASRGAEAGLAAGKPTVGTDPSRGPPPIARAPEEWCWAGRPTPARSTEDRVRRGGWLRRFGRAAPRRIAIAR